MTDEALLPSAPLDLREAGRRLWEKTLAEIEFQPHELELLGETCRTLDAVRLLQNQLDADGVIDISPQGRRVHPALPELRQQRIVLARLLAALQIPDDEPPGAAGTT
ncbi:MAG: terminase, partial [Mycobacterium sp.]